VEDQALKEMIDIGLQNGTLRPSGEDTASPIFFAKKADGGLRPCVDYRLKNSELKRDSYPLPNIKVLLDEMVGCDWYTKLDLTSAYNQLRIREGDEWKTAFRCKYGIFEYQVLSFGLCNAPAHWSRFMDELFGALDVETHYLDDIAIHTQGTLEEHVAAVSQVLQILADHDLYANPAKCEFHKQQIKFAGFIVGKNGHSLDSSSKTTIKHIQPAHNLKDLPPSWLL